MSTKKISNRKRVAIIGGGISGLSSAYLLHEQCDVTLFEKNDYIGGHTDTHSFRIDGKDVRVDSGFIIFCPEYYPHFSAMLADLGVESQKTNMSFSAFNPQANIVYNATNPNKLFCDRRNFFRPRFLRMIWDIVRFYRTAISVLDDNRFEQQTVRQYLETHRYGSGFQEDHLMPMISALWSATPERVNEFPIQHLVDFFHRHGLMKIIGRPQWLVVKNGSSSYVEALQKKLRCQWRLNTSVTKVTRSHVGVTVHTEDGLAQSFDAVIFACHADRALSIIDEPSEEEINILSAIPFEPNHVVVHTDESIMHSNRQSWASWNTEVPTKLNPAISGCCSANYWMNSLQSLPIQTNVFTTLNSHKSIDRDRILIERHYRHPIFTKESVAAQKRKNKICGQNHSFFVGAYWGWGFHEDGARSAFETCKRLQLALLDSPQATEAA